MKQNDLTDVILWWAEDVFLKDDEEGAWFYLIVWAASGDI